MGADVQRYAGTLSSSFPLGFSLHTLTAGMLVGLALSRQARYAPVHAAL